MPFSTAVRRVFIRTLAAACVTGIGTTGLTLSLAPMAAAAGASSLYVSAGGTDDNGDSLCTAAANPCRTIQQAVNVAVGGATVHVGRGRFDESVFVFGKSLSIVGAGQDQTVITGSSDPDSPGNGSGFSFFGADTHGKASLSDLSVVGSKDGSLISGVDASLMQLSVDRVTVRQTDIGVMLLNATSNLSDSTVTDNQVAVGQVGGSLRVSDSLIANSVIPGLPAEDGLPAVPSQPGVGVAVLGSGTATVQRTTVRNAGVGVYGDLTGGIGSTGAALKLAITDSTINAGALPGVASLGDELTIDNSTLSGNAGANVMAGSGQVVITRSTLTNVRPTDASDLPKTGNVLDASDLAPADSGVAGGNSFASNAVAPATGLSGAVTRLFGQGVRQAAAIAGRVRALPSTAGAASTVATASTASSPTPSVATSSASPSPRSTSSAPPPTASTSSTAQALSAAAAGTTSPTAPKVLRATTTASAADGFPIVGAPTAVPLPKVSFRVQDSILDAGGKIADCNAKVADAGYNVSSDEGNSCGWSTAHHSLARTAPQLGALADNGGPTATELPRTASPVLDAIPVGLSLCTTGASDQRGVARPQGDGCDLGAVEAKLPPITIRPDTLPAGQVGKAYRVALVASGGAGARYVFSLAPGGRLPSGLALSSAGVLAGTPQKAGRFTVTVSVNDPTTKTYTLVIAAAPVVPAAPVLASTGFPATMAGLAGVLTLLTGAGALVWGRRRDPVSR